MASQLALVTIRPCRAADLRELEWDGAFAEHRSLIEEAFRRARAGDGAMIVAEVAGSCAGQIWVDLIKKRTSSVGVLWALRVRSDMRGLGLGTALIGAGERIVAERGLAEAELAVDRGSEAARGLYERLGYHYVGDEIEPYSYVTPAGERIDRVADLHLLRKRVAA